MSSTSKPSAALVGDLGGTNARFAIADAQNPGAPVRHLQLLSCAQFESATAAIESYIAGIALADRPTIAVLAVAGPVTRGAVRFTNNHWQCSEAGLQAQGFSRARLINDFEALAHAAPWLGSQELQTLGGPSTGIEGGSIVVLGPGTGFGLSALARSNGSSTALATEAGHALFAPTDEFEDAVVRLLRNTHKRVSVETLLCGPGLLNLYQAMAALQKQAAVAESASQITAMAQQGDALATQTVARFCGMLGSVAGDAALAYGARGGVYVTGGLADIFASELRTGSFRARFEDKAQYRDYASAIPTWLITRPQPALLGAAAVAHSLAQD